jgi:adenylate cyclase
VLAAVSSWTANVCTASINPLPGQHSRRAALLHHLSPETRPGGKVSFRLWGSLAVCNRKPQLAGLFTMSGTNVSDLTGPPPDRRKLIAVLHADMVGYSRLIGLDDVGTLQRLRTLRGTLIDPAIGEHGGRIVNTGGDSLLVVFDSTDGAVRCAMKVQQQVPACDGDQPFDRTIRFRVGINVGDVIPDGTDVHGDVVNVAARLQAECPPGGICVSRTVRDHMQDRLNLGFQELGPLILKNISRPVEAFLVRFDLYAAKEPETGAATGAELSAQPWRPTLTLPDEPSLAILPFQNISGDPEQEYFADGMVEELITALSRVRWLFVIARNSSFAYKGKSPDIRQVGRELGVRYVLEGSVRKAANRVRITGQLIDALSGAHIWADRFEGDFADVFDLQDQVTMGVVAAIEPKLRDAEIERAKRKPTANLQAYDLILRALPGLYTLDADSIAQSIEIVDRAIILDPNYARALALKARLHIRQVFTIGAAPVTSSADIVRLARLAAEKGRDDPEVLWMSSFALATAGGDLPGAMALIDRSLSLNPHCAEALAHAAMIYAFSGDRLTTIAHADRALRLNPMGRAVYNIFFARSVLDFVEECYAGCLDWATRSLRELPEFAPALRYRAASLSHLGRREEARDAVRKLLAVTPNENISSLRSKYHHMATGVRESLLEGLRLADLPEE